MEVNREAIAWASGYFEGEGSFTIANGRKPEHQKSAVASLASTD